VSNNRVKHIKNKSVTQRWFASYFLLLLIPLVVSLSVYLKIETTMEQEIERSNSLLLLQVQKELDNVFDVQTRLCIELAFDEDVDELINEKNDIAQAELKQRICNKLRTLRLSNEHKIDDLFVYFYDLDTVITSNAVFDGKTFYYSYYTDTYQSYEEWSNLFRENTGDQYAVYESKGNFSLDDAIVFSKSIPISSMWGEVPRAMVGTIFNPEKVNRIADTLKNTNDSELVIVDKEGRVFFKSSEQAAEKMHLAQQRGNDRLFVESGIKGWRYFVSASHTGYHGQIIFGRVLILLYVIFTLLVGWFLSKRFIRQNYEPVAHLMNTLKAKRTSKDEYDEFEIIFNEVSKILDDRENMSHELKDVKKLLRQNYLSGLLTGQIKDCNEANELGEEFGIHFSTGHFIVALLDIEDYETLFVDEDHLSTEQRRGYYQLIIVNIMEELLGEVYECHVFEVEGLMAALVGIPDSICQNAPDDVCNILGQGVGMIEKHFGILVGAAVSNMHKSFQSIGECYYEAYDGIRSMQTTKQFGVMKYADMMRHRQSDLHVQTEQEIYLSNFIRAGEKEKAREVLAQCFDKLTTDSKFGTELLRCNMFNLLNVMYKAAEDCLDERTDFSKEEYQERLLRCNDVEPMRNLMYEVCERICDFADTEGSKNSNIVEQVKQLVEEKYCHHSFGVMEIGEHFGLTPSYVSRIFKNETKELLADYITRQRINQAKLLMKQRNDTIEVISGRVGYLNSKIFSRAFKKVEGILPSQYREMVKKEKDQ